LALVVACLVVLAFVGACHALKIFAVSRRVLATAHQAMTAIRDPALDDMAKEKAAQQAAIGLFSGFLSLTFRALIAVLASAAVIYAADITGVVPASVAIDRLESWEFIVATTAAMIAAYLIVVRIFPVASRR
jgi:hypothetical protein